jgi:hypothetical protein
MRFANFFKQAGDWLKKWILINLKF